MKKKVLSLLVALMALMPAAMMAQQPAPEQMPQLTPMPLKPSVKSGVLPNGLHYYVLKNAEPAGRANFYIAQKVGSTLETPEQLGLAHFLEHMAFNGTKTYPGKNLLNYLQSKGIRFGADINAYTSFDETVYNIDNVPTSDVALMDSVLLALRDWSCNILLEDTEIEAERGVINEEWRQRNDAQTRMYTAILPEIYDEYQYEQMPIGKMEVVMNFPPQVLKDYYHKWYRPDQQGIVIVGDFDADVMEKKVIDLFSAIPMPENAAERTYPYVSNNQEPIYVTFEDPEMPQPLIMVAFKYDKTPWEMRNTVEMYLQDNILLESVLAKLINNRLTEYSQKPEAKFAFAGCRFGTFYVSNNKGSFSINIVPKGDNFEEAFIDAMSVVAQACKTGFTNSELERVDSEIISNYENMYNERDKTKTEALASELIRHFIDNEPAPGIEMEYQIVSNVLPQLPVQEVNAVAQQILTPENQVVVLARPKSENPMPAKETMVQALNNVLNAEYEAFVDEVITEPLVAEYLKPGKVKSVKDNAKYDTKEILLSNGVKVVVKPTDFAADEIMVELFSENGKKYFPKSQAANLQLVEDAYSLSNFGNFDMTKLTRYLSGKKVNLEMKLGLSTWAFEGSSNVKDLPTLMELIYASFVELKPNKEQYETYMSRILPMVEAQDKDPGVIFRRLVYSTIWGNNPVMIEPVGMAQIKEADYDAMYQLIRNATANAADFTMVITGNVDVEALKPYLEQYVASLPSTGKKTDRKVENMIAIVPGEVENTKEEVFQTPFVNVYNTYSGNNLAYDMKNSTLLDIFSDILQNNFTTTLREEEGGTYGAGVYAQNLPASDQWQLAYQFQTNAEKENALRTRAHKETLELMKNGANAEEFNKVKGAAIAQNELSLRKNEYWKSQLVNVERGYDLFTGKGEFLNNLTLEDFNKFAADFYKGGNRVEVVLTGVTE